MRSYKVNAFYWDDCLLIKRRVRPACLNDSQTGTVSPNDGHNVKSPACICSSGLRLLSGIREEKSTTKKTKENNLIIPKHPNFFSIFKTTFVKIHIPG